ncbi:MAG: hypothetical protein HRT38_20145 [Alteromonadaceae bacterium]|nr:hypothetical protein [Alteromonadaceae bacterium]
MLTYKYRQQLDGTEPIANTLWQDGRPIRIATPELALSDLKRVKRNLHMVDLDIYKEVING